MGIVIVKVIVMQIRLVNVIFTSIVHVSNTDTCTRNFSNRNDECRILIGTR